MASSQLSPPQCHALFDILTHHEAYQEITALKHPTTISNFGPPLQDGFVAPASPATHTLLTRFILVLPGLRDISPKFWHNRIYRLIHALAQAHLSESYDKGSVGIRKTLATAVAAMMEHCIRGTLGGHAKVHVEETKSYDPSNVDHVTAAWDQFLQQLVYGDLLEQLFEGAERSDKITGHEPLVQAAHEYILVT